MAKFSSKVRRQVRRLARITGRKCVPFYNNYDGDQTGPHIVAVAPRYLGHLYINYVEEDAIPWASIRAKKLSPSDKFAVDRPAVRRVRKVQPVKQRPTTLYVSSAPESVCDEFIEVPE